jgi:hypothetical protein
MPATASKPREAEEAQSLLPWFVKVSPEYYDDDRDTGYGWECWAADADDAVVQTLEQCRLCNDRDPEDRGEDLDPERARVHVVEIDFSRFAGPLVHWARLAGAGETPLWKAMEAAVEAAKLPVVPWTPGQIA